MTIYEVWVEGNADYDECPDRETIGFYARREAAEQAVMQRTEKIYERFHKDAVKNLAVVRGKAARMRPLDTAYLDWQIATHDAPSKALRVYANEVVQSIRNQNRELVRAGKRSLIYDPTDWRDEVERLEREAALTHEQFAVGDDGGYSYHYIAEHEVIP